MGVGESEEVREGMGWGFLKERLGFLKEALRLPVVFFVFPRILEAVVFFSQEILVAPARVGVAEGAPATQEQGSNKNMATELSSFIVRLHLKLEYSSSSVVDPPRQLLYGIRHDP